MALTVLVLNGSLFRNLTRLTLVSYRSASPALSQARRGPTDPWYTWMFYTPRGRAVRKKHMAIARSTARTRTSFLWRCFEEDMEHCQTLHKSLEITNALVQSMSHLRHYTLYTKCSPCHISSWLVVCIIMFALCNCSRTHTDILT